MRTRLLRCVATAAVAVALTLGATAQSASACPSAGQCWIRVNSQFAVNPWGQRLGAGVITGFTMMSYFGGYTYAYTPYNPIFGNSNLTIGPAVNSAYTKSYGFCSGMFGGITWASSFSYCLQYGGTTNAMPAWQMNAQWDGYQYLFWGGFWFLSVRNTYTDNVVTIVPPPPPVTAAAPVTTTTVYVPPPTTTTTVPPTTTTTVPPTTTTTVPPTTTTTIPPMPTIPPPGPIRPSSWGSG